MGLPAGQRRILEMIEKKLSQSDPVLDSLFGIFTRLTGAERMPWIEQLRTRRAAELASRLAVWCRLLTRRPAARVKALVLLPAVTAMACALTLAFGLTGGHRATPGSKSPAARELVVKHGLCRFGLVRLPVLTC
jgi:hypothetical protein